MSNENKDLLNEVFAGDAMSVVNLDENSTGVDKVADSNTASDYKWAVSFCHTVSVFR